MPATRSDISAGVAPQHVAQPGKGRAAGLRRRRMHDDALIGREEDHARRWVTVDETMPGISLVPLWYMASPLARDADAEHAAPGIHRADDDRRAGAGQPGAHAAGDDG